MNKEPLGVIDCPYCAGAGCMRVTVDKNNKPFGYCTECKGQLRVGGNRWREERFLERHPWAKHPPPEAPETIKNPVTGKTPPDEAKKTPVTASDPPPPVIPTVTRTKPPEAKKSGLAEALRLLGG